MRLIQMSPLAFRRLRPYPVLNHYLRRIHGTEKLFVSDGNYRRLSLVVVEIRHPATGTAASSSRGRDGSGRIGFAGVFSGQSLNRRMPKMGEPVVLHGHHPSGRKQ